MNPLSPQLLPARRSGALAAALLALAAACSPAPPGGAPPRGIVLITVDTLRADHLGCYGAAADATPRMDALAAGGVRFADASTPIPVTLPAHASLMTGLPPPAHGARDNGAFRLGPVPATLAERLRGGGWDTAAFVGAVVLDAAFGLDRGFEHYDDDIAVPLAAFGAGIATYPERRASAVVDAALRWIDGRGEGSRFFTWVHLFDPHAPYQPPEPERARLGDTYGGEVAYVDREIGRLLDGIERSARAADLLVVLTADHGEGLGEHGETTHGFFLYQSTVHVPLLLWSPGRLPAGATVDGAVSLLDVAPTVLDAAGLAPLPDAPGTSLLAAAAGEPLPARALYLETYLPYFQMRWSGSRGLRQGDWKLVAGAGAGPELYDLRVDPGERADRAAEAADRVAGLGVELEAQSARWEAAGPADDGGPPLDAAPEAQLRSLGYLSGGADGSDGVVAAAVLRPDTRLRIHLVDALQEAAPAAIDRRDPAGLAALRRLAAEDPGNPRLLTLVGKALLAQGQPAEALDPLRQATAADPGDPRLRANLATALLRLGRTAEARQEVDAARALRPGDPEIRRQHGELLLDAGDAGAAEAIFQELIDGNAVDLGAWRGLGRSLAAQGRWAESAAALDRFLAGAPDALEELVLAGTAAFRSQDGATAEVRFRRALELAPGNLGGLLGLGLVLGDRGDDLGAARVLQEAVRVAPDDPRALTPFAVAAARVGDIDTARRALQRSLRLDPEQPTARDLLQQLGG